MLLRLYTHWRNSYTGLPPTIWFLSLVSLINRAGGMVVAFMTLYLTQELHFDIRQAGYVMGFFGLGALAGAYWGGRLTDRLGYYPVQMWSLILNGLMLLLVMLVREFTLMCGAVFLLSLISEVFRPANSVAIAVHSDPETRTRSVSLYRMSVNLGWAVAPALGGLLAEIGWSWLFWVDGLTCLLAALALRLLVPPKTAEPQKPHATDPSQPSAADSPYRDKPYLWFVLLTLLNAIVFMQFIWTVPVFFKEQYHWTEGFIGIVAAMNGLLVFLVEMPLIYQIDGRRPKLEFVRFGLILYALAYAAFMIPAGHIGSALLFTLGLSLGEIFVMPFSFNYAYARAASHNAGQYMALYTMAYSLANIIAPLFGTQIIAAWGYHTLWAALIGLSAVAWGGFWLLQKR